MSLDTDYIFHIACCFLLLAPISRLEALNSTRHRRGVPLIFPPTAPTRTQWIVGIGIPLEELLFEAMTTGYVLKAEYFLPSTAEQLRTRTTTNIEGRRRRSLNESSTFLEQNLVHGDELRHTNPDDDDEFEEVMRSSRKVLSSYRWSVYKGLEGLANRLGLSGRSCVLKSICETAEVPFHFKNGMLGELMHILLTPSSSADELSEHADNEYFQAERYGRAGANCQRIFRDCGRSLLDHFSNIHLLAKDLSMLIG